MLVRFRKAERGSPGLHVNSGGPCGVPGVLPPVRTPRARSRRRGTGFAWGHQPACREDPLLGGAVCNDGPGGTAPPRQGEVNGDTAYHMVIDNRREDVDLFVFPSTG